jgi:acyl carrier protein
MSFGPLLRSRLRTVRVWASGTGLSQVGHSNRGRNGPYPSTYARPGQSKLAHPGHSVGIPDATKREIRERELAEIFADVLGLAEVRVDDDFFALGGQSLAAVRIIARIRSELGPELDLRDLFNDPSVRGVADHLAEQEQKAPDHSRPRLRPMERPSSLPLSPGQARMLFLSLVQGPTATYNVPIVLSGSRALDRDVLTAALNDIVKRHESLRTVFPGYRVQHVLPPSVQLQEGGTLELAATTPFDLTAEIPLRATLFDDCTFVLVLHHIACDGWSLKLVARDLATAYAARAKGNVPSWTPLPVQYGDYTLWQQELLGDEASPQSLVAKQVNFWRSTLAGIPSEVELPRDRPRSRLGVKASQHVNFDFDGGLVHRLLRIARECNATLFMVFHAALAALLTRLGAGTDVPLGTVVAGRSDETLNDVVGFFLNTVVLRTDTSGDPTFFQLVRRVRTSDLAAFDNQDVPFERVVQEIHPARSGMHPLFQVMLNVQDDPISAFELPGLSAMAAAGDDQLDGAPAQFDLEFILFDCSSGLRGILRFDAQLFSRTTAERVVSQWKRLLNEVSTHPGRRITEIDISGSM